MHGFAQDAGLLQCLRIGGAGEESQQGTCEADTFHNGIVATFPPSTQGIPFTRLFGFYRATAADYGLSIRTFSSAPPRAIFAGSRLVTPPAFTSTS